MSYHSECKSVYNLLTTNRYLIPYLQRDYAWTWKEQVLTLLEDIQEATNDFSKNDEQYLIGMTITCPSDENGQYTLIDGQQRLTTLSILFRLFAHFLELHRNDGTLDDQTIDAMSDFKKTYTRHLAANKEIFVIKRQKEPSEGIADYEYIDKYVKNKCDQLDNRKYKSIKSICDNAMDFFENIYRESNGCQKINNLCWIFKNIQIIECNCSDELQAYTLFELINDRGRSLDRTDLLNNYFLKQLNKQLDFGGSERDIEIFVKCWDEFKRTVASSDTKMKADDVLRAYVFASSGKKYKTKELYKEMKSIVEKWNSSQITEFIQTLVKSTNSLVEVWNDIDPNDIYLDILVNELRIKQAWPIILLAEVEPNLERKKQIIKQMFNLCFTYTILNRQYQSVEKLLDKVLEPLQNECVIKPFTDEQFKSYMDKLQAEIDDNVVRIKNELVNISLKDKDETAKSILRIIETIENPEHKSIKSLDNMTLEHILPQSYLNDDQFDQWTEYNFDNKESLEKGIYSIGNMSLLDTSDNSFVSAIRLKDKHVVYSNQSLITTKLVSTKFEEARETSASTESQRKKVNELLYIDELAKSDVMSRPLIRKRTEKIVDVLLDIIKN